jgi:hypothetical protein
MESGQHHPCIIMGLILSISGPSTIITLTVIAPSSMPLGGTSKGGGSTHQFKLPIYAISSIYL